MWQFGVEGRRDGASLRAAAPQVLPGTKCYQPPTSCRFADCAMQSNAYCPPRHLSTHVAPNRRKYNFSALLRTAGKIAFHVSMS